MDLNESGSKKLDAVKRYIYSANNTFIFSIHIFYKYIQNNNEKRSQKLIQNFNKF